MGSVTGVLISKSVVSEQCHDRRVQDGDVRCGQEGRGLLAAVDMCMHVLRH